MVITLRMYSIECRFFMSVTGMFIFYLQDGDELVPQDNGS
jgi:hypothetical protein